MKIAPAIIAAVAFLPQVHAAARLKELASIEGVRDNSLVGYGLVVGLARTGDTQQTLFPAQSLANMLSRMGVTVDPSAITIRNTAAVMVTATLPPFVQPGARIDVNVSSIGDASNLQGGLLILTSLKGPDAQVYAIAQGSVVTGGFSAGRAGTSQTVNHPTSGRIPEGAIIERAAPLPDLSKTIRLELADMDFTTAERIVTAVNEKFGDGKPLAHAENGRTIVVPVPATFTSGPAPFIAQLESLTVEPDSRSRVIVNERTGTIVMGKQVHVSPVAIMHGNLSVEVQTNFLVSQPNSLSQGKTEVVPQETVTAQQEKARNLVLKDGATVEDLVRGLNAIGSTPRDIIAILQSLKAAGALEAEIEVI
ncbi:MAG TPA: flagellar basal body P-ring protein FlgI [Bryobacteraceae bacterium]|jgi:flagellar P-ring protein precursor FlgI|nr:flagellar basal body P-ring protein FlgI [Bryobacteraceae bacterium]